MFNVLKKMLKKELGGENYDIYAKSIKQNIKEAKRDNDEIFNDIYTRLGKLGLEELSKMQEHLNGTLLSSFQISRGYLSVVVVYIVAFAILAEYTVQMVAVPAMLFLSALFLLKTVEYLVNKFCYIDAHLVLIFKAALERVLFEQKRKEKLSE